MRRIPGIIILCVAAAASFGQTPVSNVVASISADRVTLTYDLAASGSSSSQFLKVYLVNDSLSRTAELRSVQGDVGNVRSGNQKTITWLQGETPATFPLRNVRFRIDAHRTPDAVSKLTFVEGGTFMMGYENAGEDALPLHPVNVGSFFLGTIEVTVADYLLFCRETGHVTPDTNVELQDDHPVTFVSWYDASAYVKWLADKSGLPDRKSVV